MEAHQIQHQSSEVEEYKIPGLWDTSWVRPFESLWSILNTYKTVNVIYENTVAMTAIGANMKTIVTREHFLNCGIFCNLSSTKNDISGIISRLTPRWYQQQLETFIPQKEVSLFFSDKISYCPKCMQNGYHSILHQLKGLKKCPFYPQVQLIPYIRQRYVFGQQSSYEGGKNNIKRAQVFWSKAMRNDCIDFENILSLPLPSNRKDMPEIEEYLQKYGIRDDFDYIKPIGSEVNDKDIVPNIGSFLLKINIQNPDIIIYNIEISNRLIIQKIYERARNCGLTYEKVSDYLFSMRFKYMFVQIIIVEMLKPYTGEEIDYKCYQIEKGKFISSNDELGIILLFFLFLLGDENIEECLCIIKENIDIIEKYSQGYKYFHSDICIHDLDINNLCVSAQYYILDEYIRVNWKKFKKYAKDMNGIKKPVNHNDLILHPIHIIYVEQNKTARIYRY